MKNATENSGINLRRKLKPTKGSRAIHRKKKNKPVKSSDFADKLKSGHP